MTPEVSISGRDFRIVEIAVKELNRRGLSVDNYKIVVHAAHRRPPHTISTVVVSFLKPDRPTLMMGGLPGEMEVELNAETLEMIGAHYIR